MKIKLTFSLQGMSINREDGLPAIFDTDDKTQFIVWRREVEHQGETASQLCCDLIVDERPPERAKKTLLALLDNKLLLDDPVQEGLPQTTLSSVVVVDRQGNITPNWIIDFDLLPKCAKPWFREIYSQMSVQLQQFIKQLRWLQNASGGHRPFASVGIFWSLDGSDWKRFPSSKSISILESRPFDLSAKSLEKLIQLSKDGLVEPISHDLIREASDLVASAPRSALLVAFAALEACVKTQLVHLMPDAKTLIEKMPSPPLVILIQEVLPKSLKSKGVQVDHFPLNKPAKEYLVKWVTQRNQVTHGVKHSVDSASVGEFILFAKDMLYLFDYYNGHVWALEHLQSNFWTAEAS